MNKLDVFNWDPLAVMPPRAMSFGHRFADLLSPLTGEGLLVPPMDVTEDEGGYLLEAELPGLSKEDLAITFEDGTVRISGEKKQETREDKPNFHCLERRYGRFTREFCFDHPVDADKAEAKFKDGIVTIHLPKTEASKPKILKVN